MSLTFSGNIKFSGDAEFSPNGKYFAISRSLELLIYETATLKCLRKYAFCDYIEDIKWSKDSTLILIGLFKRGIIEARHVLKPDWVCRVDEGLAGISYGYFSPDSRNIITICNNNIKMVIWSLSTKTKLYITMPKFARRGVSFTTKGNFMALALRSSTKDTIGVYYLGDWSLVNKFETVTDDLQDLQWSYDNSMILAWDAPLVCKLYFYLPTGDLVNTIEPYQYKLGIRNVIQSPNGRLITVGCYDQTTKIYNNISQTLITSFDHSKTVLTDNKINYFVEKEVDGATYKTKYVSSDPPIQLENKMPMSSDVKPKMGVKKQEYSYDSNFLATKNENMPNVLFIWETMGMNLQTVIIQLKEIYDFKWSPNDHILFIVTDNSKLYYFNLEEAFVTELPKNFSATGITWNENGRSFLLKDPNYLILGDFQNERANFENSGATN